MTQNILLVEDEVLVRESLKAMLSQEGYQVTAAGTGAEAIERAEIGQFDVALVDLRLPDMGGIDILKALKARDARMDVLMMTGFATVETAVQAMKLGAADYFTKPINDDEIQLLLRRLFENRNVKAENEYLKQQVQERFEGDFYHLIGRGPKMQKIYSLIRAISHTDTTVLIKGESGTGKGVISRAIHYSDPSRKDSPYVEVSCGAIPRELLESELFGHVKGAFTSAIRDRMGRFELADGGTILLDEIDALPPYLQVKLLRVLQQKVFERVGDTKTIHVDVRIIAATNRDLEEAIRLQTFREDLFYRLNVITINVPPLRERLEDIPALVDRSIKMFNQKTNRRVKGIVKEAMDLFVAYDWPGNVRELENFMERAVVLSQSEYLDASVFPESLACKTNRLQTASIERGSTLKDVLREPEKQMIQRALEQTGGNRKKAAQVLNINRTTLYNKMKKYDLK